MAILTTPTVSKIVLFGFMDGPEGFVHVGSPWAGEGRWEPYLHLCVFGGQFAAKTTAGALRWLRLVADFPGTRGLIVVPTFPQFRENVLPVIEAVGRQMGIVRGRDWDWVANRNTIEWWNGCEDNVHSAETRIMGSTCPRGAWIDEGAQCPYQAFLDAVSRVRPDYMGGRGGPMQVQVTTTGAGRANWCTQVFSRDRLTEEDLADSQVSFDLAAAQVGEARYVRFNAKTRDNPFGGEEYYQKMIRLYGEGTPQMRRYLEGDELSGLEGLVYPQWDRNVYLRKRALWPTQPAVYTGGADYGCPEPSAIPVWGHDGKGRYYLMETLYRRNMDPATLAREAAALHKKYRFKRVASDHAPEWMRALKAAGVPVVRANKHIGSTGEVTYGIGLMNAVLNKRDEAGCPMLYVDPEGKGNAEWVREIETYMRKRRKGVGAWEEEPEDAHNHAMDATRYDFELVYRMGLDPDLHLTGKRPGGRIVETRRVA